MPEKEKEIDDTFDEDNDETMDEPKEHELDRKNHVNPNSGDFTVPFWKNKWLGYFLVMIPLAFLAASSYSCTPFNPNCQIDWTLTFIGFAMFSAGIAVRSESKWN